MGVPPALGRGLIPSDAIDGQEPQPVAVLGYKFWQRHFNGDPSVVGQNLQLVRKNYTIVGVAGAAFYLGGWRRLPSAENYAGSGQVFLRRRSVEAGRDPRGRQRCFAAADRAVRQRQRPSIFRQIISAYT